MDDDIKMGGKVTIPMNTVINWVLKGTVGSIPKIFNYFMPSWKRRMIKRSLTGEDKNDPTPPSDEEIMNS